MPARPTKPGRPGVRFHVTWGGWLFLGIAVLVGLASVNNQAPLLYVLFGGMIGALHVSAVLSRRMVGAVDLRRDVPQRVWQNQTVHLGYYLRSARRRGSAMALGIEELAPQGVQCAPGYCAHLPAGGVFRAGGRFAARSRGRIRMRGVTLSTGFPFGLIEARRRLDRPADVVVWPARGRLKAPLLRGGAVETSRAAPSPATGGQDEFFGLREYRPDDNPRWIHWRRSATRLVPVIREMARPLPEVLWVALDTFAPSASAPAPGLERTIQLAATLIDHALGREYLVGLVLAQEAGVQVYCPAGGRGQQCLLLDALADASADPAHRLRDALEHLGTSALRNAMVVVLSPEVSSLADAPLADLRGRCRHLSVIAGPQIREIFQEEPLTAQEEG